jgi:phosphocarrier protein HPr
MSALVREVRICNMKGLHARAAAKFVKTAEQFDAQVTVRKLCASNDAGCDPEAKAGGTSILGLMMLGAECGATIVLQVEGQQAPAAMDALEILVQNRFGEAE